MAAVSEWRTVDVGNLAMPGWSWHYDGDIALETKLAASVREYGQTQVVVARRLGDSTLEVVKGRRMVAAMKAAGVTDVMVLDMGHLTDDEAKVLALSLGLRSEVDYAKVAAIFASLVGKGMTPQDISRTVPFTAEQIDHYVALSSFDWSTFHADDSQHGMDFGSED